MGSMAGVDHTEAPLRPQPLATSPWFTTGSHCLILSCGIVNVCHTMRPVRASSDATLPRKEQHGKPGSAVKSHSLDDTPTTTRPLRTTGLPVITEYTWVSTCFFQIMFPVVRFTAATHAPC